MLFSRLVTFFSSWSLTPGRSLINPIAFNEQLINIHIPWQIFDDVLLTSAYVIDLSSSLAIKYWWVCNTADCCCQKCNSVAMTFCVAVTGRQYARSSAADAYFCANYQHHTAKEENMFRINREVRGNFSSVFDQNNLTLIGIFIQWRQGQWLVHDRSIPGTLGLGFDHVFMNKKDVDIQYSVHYLTCKLRSVHISKGL